MIHKINVNAIYSWLLSLASTTALGRLRLSPLSLGTFSTNFVLFKVVFSAQDQDQSDKFGNVWQYFLWSPYQVLFGV